MSPVLLAAYDSAHSSAGGDYWVWSHHEVLADLRNCVYYNFLAKALPKDGEDMGPGNCVGGYVQITDDWGCWYRFFDGGRDQFNRLGRLVICCGFVPTRGSVRWDCSSILDSAPFRDVAALAWSGQSISPLRSLEFTIIPESIIQAPNAVGEILRGEEITVKRGNALHLAGQIAGSMPRTARWHLEFQSRGDSVAEFSASLLPRKEPQPELPSGDLQGSVTTSSGQEGFQPQSSPRNWPKIILILLLVLVLTIVAVWIRHYRMRLHHFPGESQLLDALEELIGTHRKKVFP